MVITQKKGNLEYLTAEGISAPHCFTTRLGGVSEGYLRSLNLGMSRGDDPENVRKNYAILGEALGFDPKKAVLSRQVHSNIVLPVGEGDWGAGLYTQPLPDCDGLVTNTPGTALVVFTADCTPILFWDPVTGAVGAAHAGWRGTVSGIAAKTVEAMRACFGSRPEDIRAAIGPNIGACHFETGADVPRALLEAFGPDMNAFIRPQGEKYYVDLKAVNAWVLRRAGVNKIDMSGDCTVCQSHRFWSHRVTQGRRGSQGAVIVCGEVWA